MRRDNVELRIEELVLRGFAPSERHRIGEAIERELARLIAERGLPTSLARGGEVSRLDAGAMEIAPGLGPDTAGARVARALYGGMMR